MTNNIINARMLFDNLLKRFQPQKSESLLKKKKKEEERERKEKKTQVKSENDRKFEFSKTHVSYLP